MTPYVEYAERGKENGILFVLNLFCEYMQLEYVRIHVIYRDNQAEYGIHILVVAPQEHVNIYSTHRSVTLTLCVLFASSQVTTKLGQSVPIFNAIEKLAGKP